MALLINLQEELKNAWNFEGLPEEHLQAYKNRAVTITKLVNRISEKTAAGKPVTADERNLLSVIQGDPYEVTSESSWSNNLRHRGRLDIHHLRELKRNQLAVSGMTPAQHLDFTISAKKRGDSYGNAPSNGVAASPLGHKGSKRIAGNNLGSVLTSLHPQGTNEPAHALASSGFTPSEIAEYAHQLNKPNVSNVANRTGPGGLIALTNDVIRDYYEDLTKQPYESASPLSIRKAVSGYVSDIQNVIGQQAGITDPGLIKFLGTGPQAALAPAIDLLKNNKTGAAIGASLDRDAAVSLGKGDFVGGAQQMLKNALIGSATQGFLKLPTTRAIGGAVLKRLPTIGAKMVGGSASTLGAAAPAMALWGAYDIADGIVEGATQKGITERVSEQISANRAKTSPDNTIAQLMPKPRAVMANTPTGVAQLTSLKPAAVPQAQSRPRTATAARTQGQMMPKPVAKPLDIGNEIEFGAKQVRGVLNRIFPPQRPI
jgi:hypothetical protein